MTATQAPAGGLTSKVNGQFYNGGEFMPVTGLFCGKKGAARLAKWEKFAAKNKTKDLGGVKFFELSTYAGGGVWNVIGYAIANTHKDAESAFVANTKIYAKEV